MRTTPYEIYVHEIYGADSRSTPHQLRNQKGLREIKHYLVADTFRSLWFATFSWGVLYKIGLEIDEILILIWTYMDIYGLLLLRLDWKLIKY